MKLASLDDMNWNEMIVNIRNTFFGVFQDWIAA